MFCITIKFSERRRTLNALDKLNINTIPSVYGKLRTRRPLECLVILKGICLMKFFKFEPQKDITAFELALLLPWIVRMQGLTDEDIEQKLHQYPGLQRHLFEIDESKDKE